MDEPPPRRSRADQRRETEARILAAARARFAESGYERTTIRSVAAAAEVDPGLVMHYFGSKAELFSRAAAPAEPWLTGGTAEEVLEQLLDRLRRSLRDEPTESLAVLRSMLTHPEAAREMRGSMRAQKERVSVAIPGPDAELRAAIISATLVGVAVGRHLLELDHLRDADPERIIAVLEPCLRSLTGTG
jgi:AcrR family transcriptional regulator